MTILPTAADTHEVSVFAVVCSWILVGVIFSSGHTSDEGVERNVRRRSIDGTWTYTTEIAFRTRWAGNHRSLRGVLIRLFEIKHG